MGDAIKTVRLLRTSMSAQGTFGTLYLADGSFLRTGELPWGNNLPDASCIPVGTYKCNPRYSAAHGECYELQEVLGRKNIQIHAGNFCGSRDAGLRSDVLGCILVGENVGRLAGQLVVTSSKAALARLLKAMDNKPFMLEIVEDIAIGAK